MADLNREQGVETGISGEDAAAVEQRAGVSPQSELKVDDGPDDALLHDRVTVVTAGTRISLVGAAVRTREILVKNPLDNSGNPVVYVGGSTVTAVNGYPLAKGEAVGVVLDNAEDEVFVDASVNGTDVVFIATDKDK
jgi:hypothetical protein